MTNKKRDEVAAVVFKQRRQEEALAAIEDLDRFRSAAALCHEQAESRGIGLRFMATKIGVLAVEVSPGAFEKSENPLCGREVQTNSDDPQVTALLSLHTLGGSYMYQVAERECRAALKTGPKDVKVYNQDWDYWFAERRKQYPIQSLPMLEWESTWPQSDDINFDRDSVVEPWHGVPSGYADDLFTDGFQIIDASHQKGSLDD